MATNDPIEKHQFIPPPLVRLKPMEWHRRRRIGERIKDASRSRCKTCGLLRDNEIHEIGHGARVSEGATDKARDPDTMMPTGRRGGPLFKPKGLRKYIR